MRIIAGQYRSRSLVAPAGLATRPTSDRLRETLFNVLAPRIQGSAFLDLYAGSGAVGIEALSRGANRVTFVERAPAALKVMRDNLSRLGITAGFTISSGSVAAFLRRPPTTNPATRHSPATTDGPVSKLSPANTDNSTTKHSRANTDVSTTKYSQGAPSFSALFAEKGGNATPFDLVFLDPPYDATAEYATTLSLLASTSLITPDALVIAEHRRKQPLEDHYGSLARTRLLEQGDASLSFYQLNSLVSETEVSETEVSETEG